MCHVICLVWSGLVFSVFFGAGAVYWLIWAAIIPKVRQNRMSIQIEQNVDTDGWPRIHIYHEYDHKNQYTVTCYRIKKLK